MRPDFVCIGPEKTGTTWLFSVLENHPQVYLPPVKELRFLDEGGIVPAHTVSQMLFSDNWHYAQVRTRLKFQLKQLLKGRFVSKAWRDEFAWHLHYTFGARTLDWYEKLFADAGDRISGDISPLYYHAPEAKAELLASHNPHAKILIFVRDPVERTWSKAKMNLMRHQGQTYDDVGEQAFFDLFDHIFDEWVSYEDTIALWERHFEQVYVGLFDDLKATPDPFYASVCEFLGIEALAPETRQLGGVVNKGIEMDIPKPFLNYLIEQYADEIRWWSERKNQAGDQYAWASKYAL